ncbi:MAG: polyketide synthase, partial [Bryobacterales bacterium]|nr:polyketide synthase [Bryobacterales bacterium]
GFTPVVFPAEAAQALGQQVILAASDGWVRLSRETLPTVKPLPATVPGSDGTFRSRAVEYFRRIVADALKMPAGEISATEPLEAYGIDSILINQINARLRSTFGDIRSTLLFEAQTVEALAEHFLQKEREALERVLGETPMPVPPPAATPIASAPVPAVEAIAIIGISGHYPQSEGLAGFWRNLSEGKDCVTEIPADRWPLEGFFEPDPEQAAARGRSYSKWGSFLNGFADFDPLFFQIPPSEAIRMDPQERLFLQAAWEAMEDAGHTRAMLAQRYSGRIGVFAGISRTGFDLCGPAFEKAGARFQPRTSFSSVANRVSYLLNLHGPSMPVDTMCSSSLTAIHEACEHLRRGTCDLVFAGGVNLFLHPSSYVELSASGMLSKDGRCKAFGAGGDGFVPGEGVGVVLLKPLQRALQDGDNIHAVILGSSVNHGGKTNGYTVPNPLAQADLIRAALDQAGVHARTISYIEAHGTGTELGDPIEITGLQQAFEKDTQETGFCAIGSVKSNLGHLEAAAGIAGLTKVVLQMKHGRLAPSLHTESLNPNINFSRTPFFVQKDAAEWRAYP